MLCILLFYVFWFDILPILTAYENLVVWSFYGWTENSAGQIKQASLWFFNNGTKSLTLGKIIINGTSLKSSEWGCYSSSRLDAHSGERVFVAPETAIFELGESYNFTIETSGGNHYAFSFKVEENLVKPENLSIRTLYFNLWPDWSRDIGVGIDNYGSTPAIITHATVIRDTDDKYWEFEVNRWFFPGEYDSFILDIGWNENVSYYVRINTIGGSMFYYEAKAV